MNKGLSEKLKLEKENPSCIIVSVDKDLNMIPGWHYNIVTNERYLVHALDAQRNFYRQCIPGDTTDNIPGIYTITGAKATKNVLAKVDELDSEQALSEYVSGLYKGHEQELNEIKQLLWIKREEY